MLIMDLFRNMGTKHIDKGWSQNDFQFNMLHKNFNLKTKELFQVIHQQIKISRCNIQNKNNTMVC